MIISIRTRVPSGWAWLGVKGDGTAIVSRAADPLRGVPCRYCGTSKYFRWRETLSDAHIQTAFQRAKRPVSLPLHSITAQAGSRVRGSAHGCGASLHGNPSPIPKSIWTWGLCGCHQRTDAGAMATFAKTTRRTSAVTGAL